MEAAIDGNIVPVILEYPHPSTTLLYSLVWGSTGYRVCTEMPCFESTRMEEDMDSFINDPSIVSTCNVCVILVLGLKTPLSLLMHKFNYETKKYCP